MFQMLIIALLGSAISQAKTYRCPRTRRQLGKFCDVIFEVYDIVYVFLAVVQMAEEYYNASDYSKALT